VLALKPGSPRLAALEYLYPVTLDEAPSAALYAAEARHGSALLALDTRVPFRDLLRLALVMQCNAFDSGLYLHLSIFNHACGHSASAVKWSPHDGGSIVAGVELGKATKRLRGCSEVWTTRYVRAGEEITISYVQPPEAAPARRRDRLQRQFLFRCECAECAGIVPEQQFPAGARPREGPPAPAHLVIDGAEDELLDEWTGSAAVVAHGALEEQVEDEISSLEDGLDVGDGLQSALAAGVVTANAADHAASVLGPVSPLALRGMRLAVTESPG